MYDGCIAMTRLLLLIFLIVMAGINVFGQQAAGCPTIRVVGPDQIIQIVAPAFFRVDVEGVAADAPISYDWEVVNAVILDGQGTNLIRINAPPESANSNIRATVTVGGLPATCEAIAFEIAGIAPIPYACPVDEYGDATWEEEQARLDNMLTQLNNNPDANAVIQISIGPGETVDNAKKHITKIAKFFRWRNPDFDLRRLFFAIQKVDTAPTTRLYLVPHGEEIGPLCGEGCTLINGKNLSL